MNLGRIEQALAFVRQIRPRLNEITSVESVICPPFTVLTTLAEVLRPSKIGLGAQNMHWVDTGAYTGEISASMLEGLCQYVIIGHSERRTGQVVAPPASTRSNPLDADRPIAAETNFGVNRKVHAALAHGITPIICVGEDLAQNDAGETLWFVGEQIKAAFMGLNAQQAATCVVAYEPIWAIGSGKAATPAEANRIISLAIRGTISELFNEQVAQTVRIQYGGSVSAKNISAFMAMPDIDGALVGGVSIKPEFVELVRQTATNNR